MSGYASYDDAFDPKYGEPHPVPIVMATTESLKGYGTIVTDFDKAEVEITPWPAKGWRQLCPGTGNLGGVSHEDALYKWAGDQCVVIDKSGVSENMLIGRLPKDVLPSNRSHVLVREANYHPDGGQVFYPSDNSPYVALLALPGDDIKLEDFVAFYFDGSYGLQIHADIWHQPVYPISDEVVFLGKQGAVCACMAMDTVNEFGKYLKVPLVKPE